MKKQTTDLDVAVFEQQLKGAIKVDLNSILQNEITFLKEMKSRFGKDKIVDETEKRVRDLFRVFARASNEAFPTDKQIGEASLGLLSEPLERYNWTILIAKKD